MNTYFAVKLLHILSATVLFGTGLGTAFFMWRAMASDNIQAIAVVAENVVRADTWFTTPAVLVQPLTGIWLVHLLGLPLGTRWILLSLVLFVLVGACWIPVLFIQHRVARRAQQLADESQPVSEDLNRLMRYWYGLGWPAFLGMLAIFYLMVFKPALA